MARTGGRRLLPAGVAGLLVLPGVALLGAGPAWAASGDCVQSGPTTMTCTYTFTGGLQSFSVPAGVTSLDVVAVGAAGGTAKNSDAGGVGASVEDTAVPVTPGALLTVVVGGVGAGGDYHNGGSGGSPGGGGNAGDVYGNLYSFNDGGGGGGFSGVLTSADVALVVAGGGGGGGYGLSSPGGAGDTGGGGGTASGTRGGGGAVGGQGGSGGPGADGGGAGTSGSGLQGGTGGGAGDANAANSSGGGGGGGYAGGGGGGGGFYSGGGGGGSSYGVTGLTNEAAATGPAQVVISYTTSVVVGAISATSGGGQSTPVNQDFGQPLVATVTDSTGQVMWPGQLVTFTVTSGDASFGGQASAQEVTDQNGQATSPTLSAGSTPGPVTVTASATAAGDPAQFSETVTGIAPTISGTPPPAGVGEPYSFAFTVSGNPTPTITSSGTLPPGLQLSSAGVLAGTPSKAGSYAFTVTASNGVSPDASEQVSLLVRGRPAVRINDQSVVEGNTGTTPLRFTLTLSRTSTIATSVHWATANGTAKVPGDFTAASGTVTFAAGQRTATVTVLVHGDRVKEPNETFFVLLTQPSGLVISDGVGVGGIVNDD